MICFGKKSLIFIKMQTYLREKALFVKSVGYMCVFLLEAYSFSIGRFADETFSDSLLILSL